MIPLSAEENTNVRDIIAPPSSFGRHTITFTRAVEVKTKRYDPMVIDGVVWAGTLTIGVGECLPVRNIQRGFKQRPCRLNEISVPTTEFALDLIDVPEDSYTDDAAEKSE